MSFSPQLLASISEWGWLFGFALISLALVALAVLADALYEGYRERARQAERGAAGSAEAKKKGEPARETRKAA